MTGTTGADLARMVLRTAREDAARRNATACPRRPQRRRSLALRRDGRDPAPLRAAVEGLLVHQDWQMPTAGGSMLQQWPTFAPAGFAEHVQAVSFDADSGRLQLLPKTAAWATQARLSSSRVVAMANAHCGAHLVRTVEVLQPGSRRAADQPTRPEPAAHRPPHTAPARRSAPPKEPSAGYLAAKAALSAHGRPAEPDPAAAH